MKVNLHGKQVFERFRLYLTQCSHRIVLFSILAWIWRANGVLCFGPSTFVSLAFCLGLAASSLCDFVKLDADNIRRPAVGSVGFWCYVPGNSNSRYAYGSYLDSQLDSKFDMARSLGLTANIIGFCIWLIYLFAGCLRFPPTIFVAAGFLSMCACLFEGMLAWVTRFCVYM